MDDPIPIILHMLLNYNNSSLIKDEWAFLTNHTTDQLKAVVGVLDILKSGVSEQLDYRHDMDYRLDLAELAGHSSCESLVPNNDVWDSIQEMEHGS